MTALRASRAIESFVHLFKGGGVQRQSLWPRSAERGISFYAHKSAGGGLRGNPRRGFPLNFVLGLYVCAVLLGGGRWPVLPFDPISLVLAQRNGVEPPKKSAFLPRRLHHSRERCCLGCRYSSSPDLRRGLVGVGAEIFDQNDGTKKEPFRALFYSIPIFFLNATGPYMGA